MNTKRSNLASHAFCLNLAEVMRRVGTHVKRTPRIRWDTDAKGGHRAWLEVQDPQARAGHVWRRLASLTLRVGVAGLTYAVEPPDVLVAGRGTQDHGEALRKLQVIALQEWKLPAPATSEAQDLEPVEPPRADLSKLLDDPEARVAVLASHLVEKHTGARPSHDAALLLARAARPIAEMIILSFGNSARSEPQALVEQVLAAMLDGGLAASRTNDIAAQLSQEFTARLVDRWQALERAAAAPAPAMDLGSIDGLQALTLAAHHKARKPIKGPQRPLERSSSTPP